MLRADHRLQGRYRVVRELGQGGMGAVYEATDERFGTPVALKEIIFETSDEKQRSYLSSAFEREAKSLATARHECVPFVRDYFQEDEHEYLVMELVEGDDLGKLLEKQKRPFPVDAVVEWLRQLLDALDYLHGLNPQIIHRDIKPQNLKVTSRRRLKLLDFGIAKSGERSGVTTRKQTFVGATLDYSPIEQILRVIDPTFREYILLKHERKAQAVLEQATDERADIFAAGGTFYHLLTNAIPEDSTKRTLSVWEGQPDPLRHPSEINHLIPRPFGDIIMRAMAINREDRFGSAYDMLAELDELFAPRARTTAEIPVSEMKTVSFADERQAAAAPVTAESRTAPFNGGNIIPLGEMTVKMDSESLRTAGLSEDVEEWSMPTETDVKPADAFITNRDLGPEIPTVHKERPEPLLAVPAVAVKPGGKAIKIAIAFGGSFMMLIIALGGVGLVLFNNPKSAAPAANKSPSNQRNTTSAPAATPQTTPVTDETPNLSQASNSVVANGEIPKNAVPKRTPVPERTPTQIRAKPKPKPSQNLNCIYTNSCK